MKKGAILVLSGPSGAGKSTIINTSSHDIGEYYFSISTTTREPREGEENGVDYFFVTKEEFEEDIKKENFLEYAIVHENYYGTSLKLVNKALEKGKLVIFDIDVQGYRLVKEKVSDSITSIFITPPTLNELEKRLRARLTDKEEVINKRLENAKEEILAIPEYEFLIVNDSIEKASKEFTLIANTARLKEDKENESMFIQEWLG